ncbi:hypothetical protein ACIBQ6_22050 [Nonomuraea sp. NPDC049655]|uniref:hypothetical protein n=1 Tax=Nonomuraea sp. NPDC049655 TaxID=3364355 RepID=UPI0037AFC8DD
MTQVLAADHYGHGFRPEQVDSAGENGGAWSSWTWEDPSLRITVQGKCPCGRDVYASADTPEKIADLLRKITGPECNGA